MANGSELLLGLLPRVKTLKNERNKLNIVLNVFLRWALHIVLMFQLDCLGLDLGIIYTSIMKVCVRLCL